MRVGDECDATGDATPLRTTTPAAAAGARRTCYVPRRRDAERRVGRHRCACRDGMAGDGFVTGEGCHFGVPPAGES